MNKNITITRRQFLQIVAVGGLVGFAVKQAFNFGSGVETISETRLLLGTVINITLITDQAAQGRAAIRACIDRMQALENILSRFKPESQLSRLNREGILSNPHPVLAGLVQQSCELSQLTGGAFDITVKPLLDLYQSTPGILPSFTQIETAVFLVDYRKIDWDKKKVVFQKPGMSITLDGIAKGFIVDEGINVLKQFGFENVLMEAGGDLMGLGEKAPRSPWKIGLQAPRKEMDNLMATFNVQNQALATSGDYMQAYTPDFANNHIIDPRLGHSSSELASASVFAPTVAQADGLATAVMVMGKAGLHLIEQLPACQAYLVTKELTILKTSGFKEI